MKKAVISAGGTGGHILPAISIAKELIENGWEVHYIGNNDSMEERLVNQVGIPFLSINVQKLYRRITIKHLKFPFLLFNSYVKCVKYFKSIKPDIYIGCGGFVSGPAGLAAVRLKVPVYLQEQNSYPGITTRYLSKHAIKIFTAYDAAKAYLKTDSVLNIGNPTGVDIKNTELLNFEENNLSRDSIKLLVLGGSQGSVVINNLIESCIDELLNRGIEIIWQTGKNNFATLDKKYKGRRGLLLFDFTDKMNEMYNSSDIIVARAGALTLSEIQIKKIPSILIPLPTAAENHQYFNAKELADKGMVRMIEQKDLAKDAFLNLVDEILMNKESFISSFPDFKVSVQKQIVNQIISDMEL